MPDIMVRVPQHLSAKYRVAIKRALIDWCPALLSGTRPGEDIAKRDLRIKIVDRDDPDETDWAPVAVVIDCPDYEKVVASSRFIALKLSAALAGSMAASTPTELSPAVGVWVRPLPGGFAFHGVISPAS